MEKMEKKVTKWIVNFLVSQKQIPKSVLNAVLANLPLCNDDPSLKKAILLRTIEHEIKANGDVSEKILDYLEIIEEIDHRDGKTASGLMKQAYCDVAVDCTVRFIDEIGENYEKYVEAIERVWKVRACRMEGLVSMMSKIWLSWIKSAVNDGRVRERILGINMRYVALKAVRAYLKEAWEPSFLEVVAMMGEDVFQGAGGSEVDGDNGEKQVPVKNIDAGSAKISNANDEDVVEPVKEAIDVLINLVDSQEVLKSNSVQLHDSVGDPLPDASRRAHSLPLTTEANNINDPTFVVHQPAPELHASPFETNSRELQNTTMDPLSEAHLTAQAALENNTGQGHSISGVDTEQQTLTSSLPEESVAPKGVHPDSSKAVATETTHVQPEIHAPGESSEKLKKNEKTLTSSFLEESVALKGVHRDSSKAVATETTNIQPEVHAPGESSEKLKNEKTLTSSFPEESVAPKGVHSDSSKPVATETNHVQVQPEVHAPGESSENLNKNEKLTGDIPLEFQHLPTLPKKRKASPVAEHGVKDQKCSPRRRVRKIWTPLEEDTLREGIRRFGKGDWQTILSKYRDIFKNRTIVDLKDKWRNMIK